MLCAATALGPGWLVRSGVVLAVVTGILAVGLALRHIRTLRRDHAARMLQLTKDHGAALTTERQHNAEVVQVLAGRARTATEQTQQQRLRIGELNARVSDLAGDNACLRSELKARDLTITGLRETVRSRDTELRRLRAAADLAAAPSLPTPLAAAPSLPTPLGDVHNLPRRFRDQQPAGGLGSDADEYEPSVVIEMRAVQSAMPNLEVDQQRRHA